MHSLKFLVLLPLLAAAGCNCFGLASYRPVPIPWNAEDIRQAAAGKVVAFEAGKSSPVGRVAQEEQRNPETAFCWACLVAGGGHFYTGETTKGLALAGIAAGALIAGTVLSSSGYDECEYNPETFECEESGGRAPLWIGAGVAAGSWIYGIVDARASAARVNARRQGQGAGFDALPILALRRGQPSAGLQVRVTW